jgi:hypothetical protein
MMTFDKKRLDMSYIFRILNGMCGAATFEEESAGEAKPSNDGMADGTATSPASGSGMRN